MTVDLDTSVVLSWLLTSWSPDSPRWTVPSNGKPTGQRSNGAELAAQPDGGIAISATPLPSPWPYR